LNRLRERLICRSGRRTLGGSARRPGNQKQKNPKHIRAEVEASRFQVFLPNGKI